MFRLSFDPEYGTMPQQAFRPQAQPNSRIHMTFTKALVSLAAVAAMSAAHAAPVPAAYGPDADLASLATTGSANISAAFLFSSPSATSYTFTLGTGTYDLGLNVFSVIGSLDVSSISLTGFASVAPVAGAASFSGLTGNSPYTLTFNFGSGSTAPSIFAGTVTATPVPEAETAALALAGLGVVGLLRRRRA
jgi:MYXO-CTERM domain-containing protein